MDVRAARAMPAEFPIKLGVCGVHPRRYIAFIGRC
jgi:hypothetical protein